MTTSGQWVVFYSGRVQGVGFRYTAARIAERYAVDGFVKNLRDGRVQLVAEGTEPEVVAFLDDVRSAMGSKIQSEQTSLEARSQNFDGFSIRYDA